MHIHMYMFTLLWFLYFTLLLYIYIYMYIYLKNKRPTWCHWLFLFHVFYAQHVSDINTSIIRSLQLFYCITTLVVCSCFDVCWSLGVAGWGGIRVEVWNTASACYTGTTPTSYTETPTHIETGSHNQCGDTTERSQAPDDGCINVRNMLSIEEVK